MISMAAGDERVEVASVDALWPWFEANHARAEGAWLVTWKAAQRLRCGEGDAMRDALAAFGWIADAERAPTRAKRVET